jgi:uncharacterized protein (DUF58 family)
MESNLFSEQFLHRLEAIKQLLKRALMAGTAGERVARQKGGRVEFIDHRGYAAGDEPRYIDWNLFGRTERLYVKEFASEQSSPLYVLLDNSASMRAKSVYGKQLAAALGYTGLILGGPVRTAVFPVTGSGEINISPVFGSENDLLNLIGFLKGYLPSGKTDIGAALTQLDKTIAKNGMLVIISDLLEEDSGRTKEMLVRFVKRGFRVYIMQVVSEEEANPGLVGSVILQDSETGQTQLVDADRTVQAAYRQRLAGFSDNWRSFCNQHSIRYSYTPTNKPLEQVIIEFLKTGGLLK